MTTTSASSDDDDTDDTASHVVTAFLRNDGEIALFRRSDAVGTYRGRWGGVSGFAEGDPDEQVRREIREETGLEAGDVSFVRSGRPLEVVDDDADREWVVHPYLFDAETREIELSEEHDAYAWVSPTVVVAGTVADADGGSRADDADSRADDGDSWADRETVPALWTAYERVAPTVRSIAADDEHGAATLSIRALEVLRDRAGLLVGERDDGEIETDEKPATHATAAGETAAEERRVGGEATDDEEWAELSALADRLLEARPSMAVLRNRVNRAMAESTTDDAVGSDAESVGRDGNSAGAAAVLESAIAGIDRALEADADAGANAGDLLEGRVLTLSRSRTVLEALRRGDPSRVFVAESRPAREGTDVAEALAADSALECPIAVQTDAAVAHVLEREDVDRLVVGADTILADGSVVNKTGTHTTAIAADRMGIPATVVAAADKISTREDVNLESGAREQVYDGDAEIDVVNPTFDVTPADCVTEVVTERGSLTPDDIEAVATELAALETWRDS